MEIARPPRPRGASRAARASFALGVALAVLVGAGASAGCTMLPPVALPPDVVYPSIEPVAGAPALPDAEFAWSFEGATVRMTVPVDGSVYAGAKQAQKTVLSFREIDETEWIPAYYRAFIAEEHQEPLYEVLLGHFRYLRESLGLDSDRYAELIVTWVQSLTYRTDPVYLEPKFPVETVGDADGDCDDKTLLAAALLAREGYDVAILLFAPEQHVSLGIRSDGPAYGSSGYALVETTTPLLFGWVPDSLDGDIVLSSEPMVIRIGSGPLAYGAGGQTDEIRRAFEEALATAEALAARIEAADAVLERQVSEAETMRARMERLSATGDIDGYNALVPGYNALVEAYNAAVAERNALAAEQSSAAEVTERVADGQTDRAGLWRWLSSAR